MGYPTAHDLRTYLPEEVALGYHLQFNHHPPISLKFLPVAQEALRLAREGDYKATLELPNGVWMPVAIVVAGLHLEAFLDEEEPRPAACDA